MRIGYMVAEGTGAAPNVAEVLERGKRIEAAGLDPAWLAHVLLDAATASALRRAGPDARGRAPPCAFAGSWKGFCNESERTATRGRR